MSARPLAAPSPKISVAMITYNHAKFITQAVESVIMQKTDFPFELVISDDCSQDGTREIVFELQQRYPDRIRLLLPKSNLGMMANFVHTLRACSGQYLALLEGDDYWVDPAKLQTQSDLLDAHPEFSACFVRTKQFYEHEPGCVTYLPGLELSQQSFGTDELIAHNCVATASVMYRNFVRDIDFTQLMSLGLGDWPLHILSSLRGPIGFCPDVMAVYRIHKEGIWNREPEVSKLDKIVRMHRELRAILPERFQAGISCQIENNSRLIALELFRSHTERQKRQTKRLRRRVLRPLAAILIYFLSFGPLRMALTGLQSPAAKASALERVQEIVYFPWTLAYTRTWLHQPLGKYMHLWCPQIFDKKGDLFRP
jgi:glycosyltransferase involved in cell wall biosynthesis